MTMIINLAALRPVLPELDLGTAGVHQVEPVTGFILQLLQGARDPERSLDLWEAAARCVPTAPREAVFALSSGEVEQIIAIALGKNPDGQ